MALHGEIKINGADLVCWSARRTQSLQSQDQVSLYEVEILWVGSGFGARKVHECLLEHRYSDGCEALTLKVMEIAVRERPER